MALSSKAKIEAAAKAAKAKAKDKAPPKAAPDGAGERRMEITYRHVSALLPYARNARTHSDAQVATLAASIKRFGFTQPILIDGRNGIIAGHGRLEAAKLNGMTDVPCIVLGHLTDTERRAYILADNRLQETGGSWDTQLLMSELQAIQAEGFELPTAGFDDAFMASMLAGPEVSSKPLGPTVVSQSTSFEGPDDEEEDDDAYAPNLSPEKGKGEITAKDVDKAAANLAAKPGEASKHALVELICPHCAESFEVDRASIA